MTMEIFGCFQTTNEVVKEVDRLSLKGIRANHITLITVQESANELTKRTDGIVENPEEHHDDDFLSKIINAYYKVSDTEKNLYSLLTESGLTEEQADRYGKEIQAGATLVIGDNKLKMGHSVPVENEFDVPFSDRKRHFEGV